MFDAHGKPLKDEEADDERAVKYQECSEQKEQFEKKLEQAKLHAQEVIMERDKTPIVLTSTEEDKAWTGHNNGTKAWYVSLLWPVQALSSSVDVSTMGVLSRSMMTSWACNFACSNL